MAGRIAAVFGILTVVLAISVASQPAPTVLAVVLEVQSTGVRIVSVTSVRGVIREARADSLATAPRSANDMLVEYVYKVSGRDGAILQRGVFHARFVPIVEEPRSGGATVSTPAAEPMTKRAVMIAVPDAPGATEMTFARITPLAGEPPERWRRSPLGQAPLPPVRR